MAARVSSAAARGVAARGFAGAHIARQLVLVKGVPPGLHADNRRSVHVG